MNPYKEDGRYLTGFGSEPPNGTSLPCTARSAGAVNTGRFHP